MNDIIYILNYLSIKYKVEDNKYVCISGKVLYGEYTKSELDQVIFMYGTLLNDLEELLRLQKINE